MLGAAALNVIINTGFSIHENVLTPEKPFLLDAVNAIFKGMGILQKNPKVFNLPWRFRNEKIEIRRHLHDARDYLRLNLQKRLENEDEMMNKSDILSPIIRANNSIPGLGIDEILDEFFVFFVAGMETTSNAMSFFLLNSEYGQTFCSKRPRSNRV